MGEPAEALAVDALSWLVGAARVEGTGVAWPSRESDVETDPTLYPDRPRGPPAPHLARDARHRVRVDCCGTAGVLALALDRQVESQDGRSFADVLAADLAEQATIDADGTRWSNIDHKTTPPALEPRTAWAHGAAGIVRELLRYARLGSGRDPAYAVDWPDQPKVPAHLG